jgi:hypothetical protein
MRPAAEVYDAVFATAHDTLARAAQDRPDLDHWDLRTYLLEVIDAARELDGLASVEEYPWCSLMEDAWHSAGAYLAEARRIRDAYGADP